jgi:hypothetical protein
MKGQDRPAQARLTTGGAFRSEQNLDRRFQFRDRNRIESLRQLLRPEGFDLGDVLLLRYSRGFQFRSCSGPFLGALLGA